MDATQTLDGMFTEPTLHPLGRSCHTVLWCAVIVIVPFPTVARIGSEGDAWMLDVPQKFGLTTTYLSNSEPVDLN